jgi:hypothetical protein
LGKVGKKGFKPRGVGKDRFAVCSGDLFDDGKKVSVHFPFLFLAEVVQ